MSVECASLVSAFLVRNPAERLGADGAHAIKLHPFFSPGAHNSSHNRPGGCDAAAAAAAAAVVDDDATGGVGGGGGAPNGMFPTAAAAGKAFNWADLEARALKPPIDPMEGIPMSADDRDNTANFDPQVSLKQ